MSIQDPEDVEAVIANLTRFLRLCENEYHDNAVLDSIDVEQIAEHFKNTMASVTYLIQDYHDLLFDLVTDAQMVTNACRVIYPEINNKNVVRTLTSDDLEIGVTEFLNTVLLNDHVDLSIDYVVHTIAQVTKSPVLQGYIFISY